MPKVELHVHLEGTIRPETLLALARRRRVSLPADSIEGLREWFRFRDFDHFVEVYLACSKCLRDPEDFQTIARDFMTSQAEQGILHTEAHFTIGTHLRNGVDGKEVGEALWDTIRERERSEEVTLRLIPDIVRDVPKMADATLEWAVAFRERGVVGLGLTGKEASAPTEPYAEHFREAARRGLHLTAHAGEHAGPASVRLCVEKLGVERIGHGVRSVEDPVLLEQLVEKRLHLEVCPTSNLRLGVTPDLASHPFERLRRAGVSVSLGTDDPSLFNVALAEEFLSLATLHGWSPEIVAALVLDAARHAFLPVAEREALEIRLRHGIREAAERHLDTAIDL